jgi:hypothetical protein
LKYRKVGGLADANLYHRGISISRHELLEEDVAMRPESGDFGSAGFDWRQGDTGGGKAALAALSLIRQKLPQAVERKQADGVRR